MRTASSLLILLVLAGCSSSGPKANRTPDDKKKYAAAVEQGRILYGMTSSEVSNSVGSPIRKRKDTIYGRPMTRWDYHGYSLYLDEDGYVAKIEGVGY